MTDPDIVVHVAQTIGALDADQWQACAGTDNPFVSYGFLSALEKSGSAVPETGWLGQHIILKDADQRLLAVMPLYLKSHSQGEYVFDHAWADAYERAGGRYYPKLQACVPFTPATGPRILVRPDAPYGTASHLIAGAVAVAKDRSVSSLHVTFAPEDQARRLADQGFLLRNDQQFHWVDQGYGSFDGFLEALASRKRKQLRKERRQALDDQLDVRWLSGAEISESHWDCFFDFYIDTGSRKWGRPYLTREFFSLVQQAIGDRVVLMFACRDGRPIAGALNFRGTDTLYGRYWGCCEDHRFLHFELCYYQAIDYALAHGLTRVEAGAQGPHKLARGYAPVKTWSAHWLADPGFSEAVARYLESERAHVDRDVDVLMDYTPFKKGG